MPYRLRKAPGKALFWVVGEDGKHFSKEPMPKEKAKAQLRALYVNAPPEEEGARKGAGFMDDIRSALKSAYNEVADMDSKSWKKVKSVGDLDSEFWVTKHLPTATQKYLEDYGGVQVTQCIVRKAPVTKALEVALEAFSLGKWEETKRKLGYDSMFHLAVIVNKDIAIQKLARVDVGKADNPPNAEFRVIKVTGVITLRQMLEKTRERMGDQDFYKYDPFNNNCQDFINNLLLANSDVLEYDRMDREFVKQPMDEMIADLPKFLPKFARTITSLGGLVGGAGKEPIDVEVLFSALEDLVGGAYGSKDTYRVAETRTLEGREREGKRKLDEIEASLRALAHKFGAVNTPEGQLAAVGARVMADDAYEHRTGEPIDVGHRRYAEDQIKQAFRLTRPDQIAELGRVNETMARYGLEGREGRAEAYRILYEGVPPPRAPEPVARIKTPAEIRAEEEAEERERAAGERERARLARVAEEEATARRLEAEALAATRAVEEAEATAREEARRAEARRAEEVETRRRAEEAEARAREAAEAEARAKAQADADREAEDLKRKRREAEAEAARLRLEALQAKTLDDLAFVEDRAIRAVINERDELRKEEKFYIQKIEQINSATSRLRKELARMESHPEEYVNGFTQVLGYFVGANEYRFEMSPKLNLTEAKLYVKDIERKIADADRKYPELMAKPVPVPGDRPDPKDAEKAPDETLVMRVGSGFFQSAFVMPPHTLRYNLTKFKSLVEDIQRNMETVVPENIRKGNQAIEVDLGHLRSYQTDLNQTQNELRDAEKRITATTREFKAKKKELEDLLAKAEKGKKKKGKGVGTGQEHLPFPYVKKRASKKEKAVERSRHYRTLYKGALMGNVESEDLHTGKDVEVALKEKRKIEKATPKKKLMEKLGDVIEFTKVAPPELKAVVDKRGPKVFKPKVTMPKKDSVRKPYVGKVMRETFMEKVKGRGEKEARKLFNRAKRLYKEGGRSWEDITQQLAG